MHDAAELDTTGREQLAFDTLADCVRFRARRQPDVLALYALPELQEVASPLTYGQLDRRARALAARLQELTEPGARVLLVMANHPDYVVGLIACMYARCVGVNLLLPSRAKHVARLCGVAEDCGATVLLTSGGASRIIHSRMGESRTLRALHWIRVDEVGEAGADRWREDAPDPESLALLQYTSGSTGAPRGVMVRHGNMAHHCAMLQRAWAFTPRDHAISWLPLYHDMGLFLGPMVALYAGFPIGLTSPLAFVKHPDRWLRQIAARRATFSGGPNFCYDLCADVVDPTSLAGVDLSCWTRALNGAEPVRTSTLARFQEAFGPLGFAAETMCPAYGLAEVTLVATSTRPGALPTQRDVDPEALGQGFAAPPTDGGARRLTASGLPTPGVALRIVDPETGAACAPLAVGEVWLAGPSVTAGYWRRPDATARAFGGRLAGDDRTWLRTGDLGFVDEDGHLFITGRVKDVIVVCGRNHYPQDLEETAEGADPAVRPNFAAAFSAQVEDREHIVVVVEVRRAAVAGLDVEQVGRAVMRRVASEHQIRVDEVLLVHHGQIPKTTSGKVQRAATRALWQEGRFEAHGGVSA
ncbi:MAG: fatty acyl-AMP ligase [Alphaproteobacteria bacterium]|nr:fatty acyl-AMP ligase [Alphaproteobacteria bacterium]